MVFKPKPRPTAPVDVKIAHFRDVIDALDEQLMPILETRLRLARHIAELRRLAGRAAIDGEREAEIAARIVGAAPDDVVESMLAVYNRIFEATRGVAPAAPAPTAPAALAPHALAGAPIRTDLSLKARDRENAHVRFTPDEPTPLDRIFARAERHTP